MCFNNLDIIYHIISDSKYDQLKNFDIEDINIVKKLKFPNHNINFETINNFNENRINATYFRNELIKKFTNCSLTSINYNLCDAAHILPYIDCDYNEKYDIHNGILLSKNMHAAFDKNYFMIDEHTCRVVILYDNISNIITKDLELDKMNNRYIPELDNVKSKYFLNKRNKRNNKIE